MRTVPWYAIFCCLRPRRLRQQSNRYPHTRRGLPQVRRILDVLSAMERLHARSRSARIDHALRRAQVRDVACVRLSRAASSTMTPWGEYP